MLPNQIIQIGDGLIHHYDRENPAAKKFPEIRNSVLSSWSARGFSGWQSGAVTEIGEQLRFFLEKKGRYIVVILRDILSSTAIEFYDDINADMKAYLATHFNPAVTAAKNYLEEIRVEANAPGEATVEVVQSFEDLVVRLNHEVDLFCAKYPVKHAS